MEWPTLLSEPLNVSEATTHGVSEKPEPERDEGHEEADVPEPPVGSTLEGREPHQAHHNSSSGMTTISQYKAAVAK